MFVGVLVDDDLGATSASAVTASSSRLRGVPLRVLVAGIGNVFLGDDGFGCALAARVAFEGVDVVDFGIRGMDLAYALADYDTVVFLDATPRGGVPGTLYVIEADLEGLPRGSTRTGCIRSPCSRWRGRSGRRSRGRSCSAASPRPWRSSRGSASRWRGAGARRETARGTAAKGDV